MFEASIAPSAPPAPIKVCISSMNKMISSFSSTSLIIFFILSSNSPRYFVPATALAISREIIFLFWSCLGTFPFSINIANPSIIAVFPTPGFPNNRGLFLVRRQSISSIFLISFSLPMTGSISLFLAFCVRFIPSSSIKSNLSCFFWLL